MTAAALPSIETPTSSPFYKSLFFQVMVALVLGIALGVQIPDIAVQLKVLSDGFLKLISTFTLRPSSGLLGSQACCAWRKSWPRPKSGHCSSRAENANPLSNLYLQAQGGFQRNGTVDRLPPVV